MKIFSYLSGFCVFLLFLVVPQVHAAEEVIHEYFDYELNSGEEVTVSFSQPVNLIIAEAFEGSLSSLVSQVPGESPYRFVPDDGTSEAIISATSDISFRIHAYVIPDQRNLVAAAGVLDSGSARVIPRSSWGADEDLRIYRPRQVDVVEDTGSNGSEGRRTNICAPIERAFPNEFRQLSHVVDTYMGEDIIWPIRYSEKIRKIVVHHTASAPRDINEDGRINAQDYAMQVRGIYNFHTVTRGWGDIGYNFIIDPQGNIYEGRAGRAKRKMPVSAHVLCQNTGTIGIALLGNFNSQRATIVQRRALSKLIADLSREYSIDPFGRSVFRGEMMPNVVGHKEIGDVTRRLIGQGATSCPGTNVSSSMSQIIADVKNYMIKDYDIVFENLSEVVSITPGDFDVEWELLFRNMGSKNLKDAVVKLSNGLSAPVGDLKAGELGRAVFTFDSGMAPYSRKVNARVYSQADDRYKVVGRTSLFEIKRDRGYVKIKGDPQVIASSELYLGGEVDGVLRYPIETNANLAAGRFELDPGNSLSKRYITSGANTDVVQPTSQYIDVPVVFDIDPNARARKNAAIRVRLRAENIKIIGGRAGNVVDTIRLTVNRPDLSENRLTLANRVDSVEFETGKTNELRFEIDTMGISSDVLENLTDGDLILKLKSSSSRLKLVEDEIPLALSTDGQKLIVSTSMSSRYPVSSTLEGSLYFGSQRLRDFSGRIGGFVRRVKIRRSEDSIISLRRQRSE
jgi:hypothetical protein